MNLDVSLLITAVGLAFVFEGLPYFLFAEKMPAVLRMLLEQPATALRKMGMAAIIAGLVLVYFGQGW
jgi:hypothetical protein